MIEKLMPTDPEAFHRARANPQTDGFIFQYHLEKLSELFGLFGIRFYLGFGTLLGAYRDGRHIPNDSDQDLIILEQDEARLCQMVTRPEFLSEFQLARCHGRFLISVTNQNQYTDIYVFRPDKGNYRCCDYTIESFRLDYPEVIQFYQSKYLIPSQTETYLERIYGDWKTPSKTHAKEC